MKKVLKRLAVALMSVMLLVMIIPTEKASANDGTYTIYAKVPESWGTPYLWAWSTSGGGDLFRTWPGELMHNNGDGFYTYTVSEKYLNLILSNGGGVQTEDIVVNGSDVEIVVNEDNSYVINYRTSYNTDWENGVTVTVTAPSDWSNPYLWAWSDVEGNVFERWPGAPMTSASGSYTMEIPDWVTGVIVSANNATIQTMDIIIEPGKNVWITVNSENDIAVQYFGVESEEDPTTTPQEGEEQTTIASGDTETKPSQGQDGDDGGKKPVNKNMIYIIVTVAVFIVIILIVTLTGNGRNKKHSQYVYEDDKTDKELKDIKIDDKDLDVDDDVDVDLDDIDV